MTHADASAPQPPMSQTADLIAAAQNGDAGAKESLARRYREPLQRFLHARLPRNARGMLETEDLVQEVLLAATLQLGSFEHRGTGSFWLYLRRIGLNWTARAARRPAAGAQRLPFEFDSQDAPLAPEDAPLTALIDAESGARFEVALDELPEPARAAVVLRLELDLPYAEIASECGYPTPDAARMSICRALERIAHRLADRREGP